MRKFFFALEAEEVEITQPTDEDLLDSTSQVESVHEDTTSEVSEIEEIYDSVDDGFEASNTIMDVGAVISEKIEDKEGLPDDAVEATNIAVEYIRTRLGMPSRIGRIPTLESFRSPNHRVESTRIALETGIKETLSSILQAIIDFCSFIANKIKLFIANILKNYGMLISHLERLKLKADSLKGKKELEQLDKPSLASFFTAPSINTANYSTAINYIKINDELGNFAVAVLTTIAGETNIMEKFIHATSDGKAEVRDSMASLHQVAEKISKRILDFGFFVYQKTDKELIRVGPFPGNLFMSLNAPSTFRGAHFTIEKSDVNAEKIEALDKNQIISLLEMAIKSAKSTIDMKKISEINEKTLKEFKELSKVLYSKISGTIDPDSKDTYKTIVEAIKYLIKMTAKISSKIPSIHFSTIKHVGDYASASISNYSE